AVYKALPDIKKQLPEGCNLEVVNDDTQYIKSSISDMMGNIYLGILFTSIVLFLFLGNIRTTFIIAVTMPTSIISTFMFIKAWGLTMNQMSLMGISVTIGVLVANSVVVIENIYRHKDLGKDNKTASYIGTKEVTVAVLASTLTNLIVFIPIANMSSLVGQFLKELALSATFATLFSLLYSFTLTPMLSALILPKSLNVGKISNGLNRFYKKWDDFYKAMLRIVLKNKWVSSFIILSSFALFMVSMMIYGGKLGFEFLPAMDDGKIKVEVELPEGYNLQTTAKTLEDIENRVKKYKDVKHIITNLGKKTDVDVGSNMARMDIQLVDVKQRKTKLEQYITIFVNELASIPNTKLSVARAMEMGGGSAPIEFYLLGQDVDKLEELKGSVIEKIKDAPGLINFDNSSRPGKPEITIYPQRDKLAEAGITLQELAFTLRASVEGLESSKYRQEGNEYDIIVNLSNQSVNAPEKIANITVVSAYGGVYRLSQLADVKFTNGYTSIIHRDKFTTIKFTGAPAEGVPVGNVTNEIDKRLKEIKLPSGYYFDWGGMTKMMNEMVADFGFAFLIAILLTYMLLAAILESFLQPVFILITIPLAMIGIVTFSYYTDTSLGITSLMGIIMLIGVVVNNAILMLDYTNQLRREEGLNAKDALIEACPIKLKAIIMSTLALILGMLPMALGIGDAGKEMRTPLGIVSIGGLVVSTIMTLFVIPAFYYVTSRKRKINIEDTGAIS
ncbi:MAG: hypothetical protein QG635_2282, partial [Bacteroidota bacterium]|nr:hypothetical protein [Bacteroidota bacterium]